jgi:Lipopolysaccharide assembly protein A domain
LRRIFRWIVGLPIAISVISFAVANRQWTRLSLDPFSATSPAFSINMPLWTLFIFGVFIGILVGWGYCWVAQGKHRKLARERGREISRLQSELEFSNRPVAQNTELVPFIGMMP